MIDGDECLCYTRALILRESMKLLDELSYTDASYYCPEGLSLRPKESTGRFTICGCLEGASSTKLPPREYDEPRERKCTEEGFISFQE